MLYDSLVSPLEHMVEMAAIVLRIKRAAYWVACLFSPSQALPLLLWGILSLSDDQHLMMRALKTWVRQDISAALTEQSLGSRFSITSEGGRARALPSRPKMTSPTVNILLAHLLVRKIVMA